MSFFKSNRLVIYISLIALGVIWAIYQKSQALVIHPNEDDFKFYTYSDKTTWENSYVGGKYPFAGCTFYRPDKSTIGFDEGSRIKFDIVTEEPIQMLIILNEKVDSVNESVDKQYLEYSFKVSPDVIHYELEVDDFTVPRDYETAYDENDLLAINTISVQNDPTVPRDVKHHFILRRITLEQKTYYLYFFIGFMVLVGIIELVISTKQ